MSATIGVDIGGTKIALGVVTDSGEVVARTRRETQPNRPEEIVSALADGIAELKAAHEVQAVGVAAAGYIDAARSTVLFAPNLAWRENPLKQQVEALVDVPVVIENDANAAAWGEFRFGAGRDVDDMLMLTVGTGLGGGLVVNRRLVRGAHGVAAEFGHVRAVPDGHRCGCGNRGCWEQYTSGTALVREARELAESGSPLAVGMLERAGGKVKRITGPLVTDAARDGDPMAVELLADLGRQLGTAIASFVAILDPGVVVVGGGVSDAGDLLLGPARDAYEHELTGRGFRPAAAVVRAELGNDAGLVGAADLALAD
ncbi:ROK family glucokinase [Aquipuribacter nitratireducens]|uniref:Glucokinase n=1 Tax=Aquipuribacter nitratireducens TaxID=650104 RepID=A0ABW0GSN0_9MICO